MGLSKEREREREREKKGGNRGSDKGRISYEHSGINRLCAWSFVVAA